jgi:hypothetical protein
MEAIVSDILQSRKREPDGLKKTAAISLGAHGVAVALILVIPSVMPRAAQPPRVVMNISLGGSPGPQNGGMQMIGGRPVQAALPSAEPQIAKSILPPVATTPPKMTLPDPKRRLTIRRARPSAAVSRHGLGRPRSRRAQEGKGSGCPPVAPAAMAA